MTIPKMPDQFQDGFNAFLKKANICLKSGHSIDEDTMLILAGAYLAGANEAMKLAITKTLGTMYPKRS